MELRRLRQIATVMLLVVSVQLSVAQKKSGGETYLRESDISYVGKQTTSGDEAYRKERCKLDVYYPSEEKGFATIVYFHGGGLEGGKKSLPKLLKGHKVAVVSPNYRLFPKAKSPDYVNDAAEAVAWCVKNIEKYGGDPKKIYVCGHSAGGYLTLMLALDKKYLGQQGVDADSIAGYMSFSGQTNTHYTIRKERGLDTEIPIIDGMAPINHCRKLGTKLVLCTGDRNKEMLARYTENLHLQDILKAKGNDVPLYELGGFNHGTMVAPACLLMLEMVKDDAK